MGTAFAIVVANHDAHLLDAAAHLIAEIEGRWSRFLPDSEVSILNRNAGSPVIVSADTFQVIQAAIDGAEATGGRFDPTVHDSLVALGYDRSFAEIQATDAAAVPAPGVSGITVDAALHAVTLPAGVRIDLGGIGKGTAADLVAASLAASGAAGAAVSIGGDVRVWGESPSSEGWRFTFDQQNLPFGSLRDAGVCTSTVTRRRWTSSHGPVHHLVDPATGEPTCGTIESITVISATAQQAEVLTKAAMVAGPDAPELLESFGATAHIRWANAA